MTACASAGPAPSSEAQLAATSDIAEAVFRYQFRAQRLERSRQERTGTASPFPGEQSPDAAFLQRFDGNTPPVLGWRNAGGSPAKTSCSAFRGSTGEATTRSGSPAATREGNLSASGESYRVRRKDGKWVVDGARDGLSLRSLLSMPRALADSPNSSAISS